MRRFSANTVLAMFAALFLCWTLVIGIGHGANVDYLAEWREVLAGHDPWRPGPSLPLNAYGPLFNALAVLVWISPVAPKVVFAASYIGFVAWLGLRVALRSDGAIDRGVLWLCILNPFPWIEIAHFGFFDVLVGIACVAAVHAARRGHDWRAGAWLGVGILLKFVPVVLLPFLAMRQRRPHPAVVAAAIAVSGLGLAISIAIWGRSTLDPILFASNRPAVMSIYALLGSPDSPLRIGVPFDLARLEKPLLIVAGGAMFAWCQWRRAGLALSALLAILVTLLSYRSGYNNYQMIAFALLAYWLTAERESARAVRGLSLALTAWLGALLAIDAGFPVVRRIVSEELGTLYLDSAYLARWLAGCALVLVLAAARVQPSTNRGPASPPAPAASSLL